MNGRILEFIVDKQRLRKKRDCDFSNIVAGSVGYLIAKFYFSEEWDGFTKVVSFSPNDKREYPVLLDGDDRCVIPSAALTDDRFFVRVVGGKSDHRITTSEIAIKQEVS